MLGHRADFFCFAFCFLGINTFVKTKKTISLLRKISNNRYFMCQIYRLLNKYHT